MIMSAALRLRDRLSKAGLEVRSVAGREHRHAGIEFLWHKFDAKTERVRICLVDWFGKPVRFLVRNQYDYIQMHFLRGTFYAENELKFIQQYYRGGTLVDVGANVGNHTVFAGAVLKAPRIIACEPFPAARKILLCNIALNDLEEIVEVLGIGLSDADVTGEIEESPNNMGGSRLSLGHGDISVRIGDEILANEDVSFIKIDVEGMELSVLRGLKRTIRRCHPGILVEVEDANIAEFEKFCGVVDYVVRESWKPYESVSYFLIMPTSQGKPATIASL